MTKQSQDQPMAPAPAPASRLNAVSISRGLLAFVGAIFLALGAYALLTGVDSSSYPNIVIWLAAGVIAHDVILVPALTILGIALTKLLPASVRPIVQGSLIVAGVLTLIAIPVIIGGGKNPSNPSLLPLDYSRNLIIILICVGLACGFLIALKLIRGRKRP